MKRFQRIISFMLAFVLVLGMVPVAAQAEETVPEVTVLETTETVTESVEETTAPTEEEPTGETTLPTEGTTAPFEPETTAEPAEEAAVEETIGENSQPAAATLVASGDCGGNVTWRLDSDGTLTISGSGPILNLNNFEPWNYPDSMKKNINVIIEPGITEIGDQAFGYAYDLVSVTIPDTVQEIGEHCFRFCGDLERINIPASVTSIGQYAFFHCENLREIDVDPESEYFANDERGVLYNKNMTKLYRAPVSLDGTYTIPDGVTEIDSTAFSSCEKVKNVTIPGSVVVVDGFQDCLGIESVTIQDGAVQIAADAFPRCDALKTVLIPDSVKAIGSGAFYYSQNLENITIPDGVTTLEEYVLGYCTSLTEITIPDTVTSINSSAFCDCTGLTEITIPDSVTSIGDSAFSYCSGLMTATVGSGVKTIGGEVFKNCTNLEVVFFRGDVPVCDGYYGTASIFEGTSPTVYYPENNATWTEEVQKEYGENITWKSYQSTVVDSGECGENVRWELDRDGTLRIFGTGEMDDYGSTGPFTWLENVTNVVIEPGVTSIGDAVFTDCHSIVSVSIPDTVTSIGNWAFFYCTSLKNIMIPDSVASIGWSALYGCSSLEKIQVDPGNEHYANDENGVLFSKDLTKLLQFPGGFAGEYTIPDSVTSIRESAFSMCNGVTSVTVPDSVVSIEGWAFGYCDGLTSIYFEGDAPSFSDYPFSDCTATAYYPEGNDTWTEEVMQDYGGTITWVPYQPVKEKKALIMMHGVAGAKLYTSQEVNTRDYLSDIIGEVMTIPAYYTYEQGYRVWEPTSSDGGKIEALSKQNKIQSEALMLRCDEEGKPYAPLHTNAPGTEAYGAQSTYKKIVTSLVETYKDEYDVYFFSYDWRLNNEDSAKKLETFINNNQYTDVTLVCHSMGGLVASEYLRRSVDNQNKINKLITIGTPYLGAPKALYVLETGYFLGFIESFFCMATPLKLVSGNLYGVHQLLPCEKYFSLNDTTYVEYYNNNGFWGKATSERLNYTNTYEKLAGRSWAKTSSGGIKTMYSTANSLYDKLIVDGEHIINTVDSYVIIGYGEDTILEVREEYNKDGSFDSCDDITVLNGGDGTVPMISANIGGLAPEGKTYYVQDSHTGIVKNTDVIALVKNIIDGKPDQYASTITTTEPEVINEKGWIGEKSTKIKIKIECPVELTLLDASGTEWAYVSNDIIANDNSERGSVYVLGKNNDTKIAYLSYSDDEILLTGTGEGEMTYTASILDSGTEIERVVFQNVPITPDTEIYTSNDFNGGIELLIDEDGDGNVDEVMEPTKHLTGEEIEAEDNHEHYCEKPDFVWSEDHASCTAVFTCVNGDVSEFVVCTVVENAERAEEGLITYTAEVSFNGELFVDTVNVYTLIDFALAQEYVVLNIPERETYQLVAHITPQGLPEEYPDQVSWIVEEGGENVISVDGRGNVTALNEGTAYVVASVTDGETTMTARCRVDVAETGITEEEERIILDGIQLGNTKLTMDLYSTDYAEFDVLLKLPQNYAAAASATAFAPENRGVAIEAARFTDEAMAALVELIPLDDRTVAVVPTEAALADAKAVQSKYISAVTVTVQGKEYTSEALTLTVKKTLPKLKATIDAFNNFYSFQSKRISITGATVTGITCENLPDWLALNGTELSLTENVPAKGGSAKLTLLVETEEWAVPIETALSVKCSYKAPGLKLSASSIQLAGVNSDGVKLQLLSKDKKLTLGDLGVSGISAPEGYSISNYNVEDGSFVIKAAYGFQPGKINLEVGFHNTSETVAIPLTVKVTPVTLKLAPSSITLNSGTGDSAAVTVTATPADYRVTAPNIRIVDAAKQDKTNSGELKLSYENGRLSISTTDLTPDNAKYTLYISAEGGKEASLKISTTNAEPTLKLKANGNLDLSFPDRKIGLTTTFKNHSGGNLKAIAYTVTESSGKTILDEDSKAIQLTKDGADLFVQLKETAGINIKNTYTLNLKLTLENGKELESSVKIPVKQTNISLKLSANKLTLNKAIGDKASVTVTCATKDYNFTEPGWTLLDSKGNDASGQLDISWNNGKLTVATTEATPYGGSYKLQISPEEGAKAVTLAIVIPAEAKSAVTGTLKATGNLDVIRDGTALTITPTWKNCNDAERNEELKIFCGDEDVTARFVITEENGKYILTRGEDLDHTQKYTATLTATFANGTTATASGALKLKMGSAKLTLKSDGTTLFANDKHSRVNISFVSADSTLNKVAKVTLDPKLANQFELFDYGNGQYAIGFKDGAVPAKLTSTNISLNVWLEGNETTKANASVKVKLSIVR